MPSAIPAAQTRLTTILIWSIAALAALFLVWPVWRAFLPMEIWGNEGWNAYHADQAMRGAELYPPPDGLVANNYPPLSYYLLGWLGRLFGDPLYVGRAVSLVATLASGAAVAAVVRQFGGSRAGRLIGGFWFVATMARFFEFYVGMNEPQLLNLAVMAAGFAWFLQRHAEGRPVEPAVLVMVFAGFIKHNFITLPLVALIWLALDNWRLALRAALVGGAAAALGLALCALLFAPYFIPDMLMPRVYHMARALSTLGRLQFILPAMVLWAIWAWAERRSNPARFSALLIGIALPLCLIQKSGAGVDENAQFELIFATAVGIGVAYDGLLRDPLRTGWSPQVISVIVLGILIVRLLLSSRLEFAYLLASPQYRALAAENAAVTRAEAARVAAIPGPVACQNLVVCRMAGKPFVYDHFWVTQLVETGRMTWHQVEQLARRKAIVRDDTDPRASITSLWRRMRSD
ncbi:MAG: hypothetical protein E6G97_19920 [Alphaproteobacteria bacterium]|nr:MAG: hypothetical protein E6G97_19920 [Alphaproteobacteria bacterium]